MIRLLFVLLLAGCALSAAGQQPADQGYYQEPYRPQLHFSPARNWTNDPNGLVYLDGEYHLFYQYNPYGDTWGHMSWGHAVSRDLIAWTHLPLAIPEDSSHMIFSGSCVVDSRNSSGFAQKPGQVPMVAVYTAHLIPDKSRPDDYRQSQHIAYSLDHGRTWQKYAGNPVLDLNKKDFRDPKVFWYEAGKQWVMAVVLPHEHIVQFYGSPNLRRWTLLGSFGPAGDTGDIWECPDLLQVPVAGHPGRTKWVLLTSTQTSMQYFVGDFDGHSFHNENPGSLILRPDYGPDFYAAITFNHLPAGQAPVLLGWANNWQYAQAIPTKPWRSAMSLPRQLHLQQFGDTWMLLEQPVAALEKYRRGPAAAWNNLAVDPGTVRELPFHGQVLELDLQLDPGTTDSCGLRLAAGPDHYISIGYARATRSLYVDRSRSGNTRFHDRVSAWLRAAAPLPGTRDSLRLHIVLDKSILEVYGDAGEVALTTQLFTDAGNDGVALFATGGRARFARLRAWHLRSAWTR
ncbi:MAG TPA: glycoside hydrolase family 32 protein [Chitinophagaceae bacterium]|nr:glycoside hydrolase family 32 protein [Chitinophagaceae bacterium]